MPNWKKLIVSGSDATLNSLTVSNGITGSLQGTASWAINALTASYAPNMLISGGITSVDYIDFDLTATPSHTEGRVHWNDELKTLQVDTENNNVQINVGHETIQRVVNDYNFTLNKGKVVYINGEQGNRPTVATASYVSDAVSANTLGVVMADINSSSNGYIITNGLLEGVNTIGLSAGTTLYLSSSGDFTSTKPQAPLHLVYVGKVVTGNSAAGSIFVTIQNGYELEELHDVKITSSTDGDLVVKSGSLWINSKQLTGSYGLTGSLRATTINTSFLTASGLNYPATDGQFNGQVLQTNAAGTLSFGNVNAVFETIYNAEATQLTKGTLVYISGSQGVNPKAYRADSSDPNKMPVTFVVAENIASGTTGRGVTLGLITGINTTAFDINAVLWANGNGVITQTRPTGSNDIVQPIGIVTDKGVGGQINILNPGPITLPNLQTGYAWIGDANNQPIAISSASFFVNTASYANNADLIDGIDSTRLATTGSNTFNGNQTISGSLLMSGSIIPNVGTGTTTSSFSLGSATNAWNDIWVSNGTINLLDGAGNIQAALSSNAGGLVVSGALTVTTIVPASGSVGSYTGSLLGTASYASNSDLLDGIDSTRLATTGSNTFIGNQTITGSLSVSGSLALRYASASATYTASISDSTIEFTSGSVTCSLYTAVGNAGRQLYIKNDGTGVITVDANGSETIDKRLTRTLGEYEDLLIQADGVSNWIILNRKPVVMQFEHGDTSAADNTTYLIGNYPWASPTTAQDTTRQVRAMVSGWATRINHITGVAGTLATAEDSTLNLWNVTANTSTPITTIAEYNVTLQSNTYTLATPLRITKGDYIQIRWTTPNFTTNPTLVRQLFDVLVE